MGDWLRDGAAVLLLLVSLAFVWSQPWSSTELFSGRVAASHIEVLLITLLSVLSVVVGYLAGSGMLGSGAQGRRIALLRALLNLPYFGLVITYIVFDAIGFGTIGFQNALLEQSFGAGLGPAVALGLTGALLAARPRASEIRTPERKRIAAKNAYGILVGYLVCAAMIALLGGALTLIFALNSASGHSDTEIFQLIGKAAVGLTPALGFLLLLLFVLRRSEPARLLTLGFSIAALLGVFAAPQIENMRLTFGYPLLITAIGTAILSNPGLSAAMRQQTGLTTWVSTAKQAALALSLTSGIVTAITVLGIIQTNGNWAGGLVGILICSVLILGGALVLRVQIASNYQRRVVSVSILCGILVLILIAVILAGVRAVGVTVEAMLQSSASAASTTFEFSPAWLIVLLFGPASVALWALLAPREVRAYFRSLQPLSVFGVDLAPVPTLPFRGAPRASPAATPPVAPTATPPGMPTATAAPTPHTAPSVPRLAARARDPRTPATELHSLAQQRELWPYLASNPSLYPGLRQWLQDIGDPQVNAALAANPARRS